MSTNTLHITPAGSGEWAIKINETAGASSVHATQAQAVATAWEQLRDLAEAEVIVHDPEGRVRSSLTIRQVDDGLDDSDDPAARAEALRITPSNARLLAGIGKYPLPPGNFDDEEMPC
jgi:hypothetical protein